MRALLLGLTLLAAVECAAQGASESNLTSASLEELGSAMRNGSLSSVELSVLYLNRILAYDRRGPKLNAIPVLNPKWLEEAARADALRARGIDLGPLHGLPVVVKDSYNVAGLPTSIGMTGWTHLMPPEDAFIVARLRQAGAVIVGKSNLDTFAASDEGVSQAFGRIMSPYGAKRVGGSSGGSAVAVAANFAAVAFGGDTAGSLRMPASRNGVVSIRPTLGLISTRGTAPGDPLFDVIGPIARSVRDLAVVLDAVVVEDAGNPLRGSLPPFARQRPASYLPATRTNGAARPGELRGVTFAVPRRLTSAVSAPPKLLTPGKPILASFAVVREKLVRAGARVIDVDVPVDAILDDTWYYDQDVSQAGEEALAIYAARTSLANIHAFAHEWARFCAGWCGDPADRMLDVAALIDYPEFRQAFTALRDGKTLDLSAAPIRDALRNSAEIADGASYKGWLTKNGIDALLFPASSDADSDTRFGLNYLSDLGLPGLFVPAAEVGGNPPGVVQPLGVALVGTRFAEKRLIELGAAVEATLQARVNPPSTPPLADESIALAGPLSRPAIRQDKSPPRLDIESVRRTDGGSEVTVSGFVTDDSGIAELRVYVNGRSVDVTRNGDRWTVRATLDSADSMLVALAKDAQGNAAAIQSALR